MAKVRSPSYPVISLREAVDKIKQVYEKDYQNKLARVLVAEHMGYRSLNGKSLGVLSAVSKYGLLEGRGDANWVSDLALSIIAHPSGSPERATALVEAARRPELFASLDAKFQDGRASDAAIRSYLLTQKFIPSAADLAIRSYRETKQFVSEQAGEYSGADQVPAEQEGASMQAHQAASSPGMPPSMVQRGEREFLRGPLSSASGYRLLISGEMGAKELGKLIRILKLQQELLSDSDSPDDSNDEDKQGERDNDKE